MVEPAAWPRAVVFDLDGTLIDSVGDITNVLNATLAEAGLGQLSLERVRLLVGSGAQVLIERALAALERIVDPAAQAHLLERFEAHYEAIGAGQSELFPGGREILEALLAAGKRLAVCTNKPDAVTQPVVDALKLRDCFGSVVGLQPGLARKPAPDMLLKALQDLGVDRSQAVMVGDSRIDLAMARTAGIPAVLVAWGYTPEPVRNMGADAVIDSWSELPAALSLVASRRMVKS